MASRRNLSIPILQDVKFERSCRFKEATDRLTHFTMSLNSVHLDRLAAEHYRRDRIAVFFILLDYSSYSFSLGGLVVFVEIPVDNPLFEHSWSETS
jgi:hypothetical protein